MKITKKSISNILFVIAIGLLLHPTSKAWILRQISFSPSIENKVDQVQLKSYNWSLKGLNTKDYDFNQAKNKVVIVNFWATWCVPCVAEMPSLQALYDDYGDKVEFLLVTSDSNKKVAPFMKERNFNMPIYNQASNAPDEFFTKTIPKTFLVSKDGKIIIDTGRANWNTKKIRSLLDSLLKE
ncbi:MAG TPA: TlpA family protein disulfide reductase [Lutibacter sp.]|nr:TlpA family protein disulfide reductase [Lutibacter sp.]